MKDAVIIQGTNWPMAGGGGLAVARNFLEALREDFPELPSWDIYTLFAEYLIPVQCASDLEAVLLNPRQSRFARQPRVLLLPAKWTLQALMVRRVAAFHRRTVVIAFTEFLAGRLVGRGKRVSIIQTEHSKGGRHTERLASVRHRDVPYYILRKLAKDVIGRADMVVFPSKGAAALYQESNPGFPMLSKCSVIYNGIPDPLAEESILSVCPDPGRGITIVNVAKHVPEKNIELIIEGVALWNQTTNTPSRRARLVNFGAGAETNKLRALAQRLGIADCVDFAGWQPHEAVVSAIAGADYFALTPHVAVFDLALLEAMALRKPILSSRVGGNIEALGSDYEGYVNDPADFASALERLIGDQPYAAMLGKRNRSRFLQHFAVSEMAKRYLTLLVPKASNVEHVSRTAQASD